jgi:Recombination endonuclease VII
VLALWEAAGAPGRTKCSSCAKALKLTDSIGARRRRYGASPAMVQALIDQQDGRCFCGKCVDAGDALDHAWETRDLRGVLCAPHNAVIGRTDAELFWFADGAQEYAGRRRRILIARSCPLYPKTK